MKTLIQSFSVLLLALMATTAMADKMSPEGQWRTIDDDTGEAKSIVKVWKDNGELKGRIIELLDPSEPNPKCTECEGDRENKPIEGMVFLWGLEKDDDEWVDGTILDPANGKQYSAKVEVIDNGAKLKVRGYMGFSLLGRTQVWERAE